MHNKIYKSRILITGGAGFIGSFVVEELLLSNPEKVIIIDNLLRGSFDNMKAFIHNPVVEFIEGDVRDVVLLEKCISEVDFVFHMAALRINACAANPQEGFEVMLNATFHLAELCMKHKVKKVIYSSSASIYGLAQHFPTPETENPYDNQTFYGGAKLWGEQLFRNFKFMYGLDYVALRYFNVYGPRMDTDGKYTEVMIRWLDCIREEKAPLIYGDGSTTMDFVYVRDVAKANVAALWSDVTDEAINVGNCVETSLKQLLEILLKVNNSTLIPEFREDNTVNPVSRRLADISKAKKILGFCPTVNLEKGLYELSDWYFKKKKVKG
ncbi:NAD-dependent epimerase/dehydratase family protein [Cyclobacterium jeungdonense]|uniref:NAD-dependent epimerase/dehydratase family protein n=1 Tax=Cyclobacterium jeungdonense TaxID=708087 RepID=A0ABT8C937_9BACT|nr:NAD-dependent epimerase/dehydratase family protein [Cyclobacterium jeungdonense]MDN3688881.1 NAD-dependent epimerase/dehydratase family protein [Cyclobacterium jeungdonense]